MTGRRYLAIPLMWKYAMQFPETSPCEVHHALPQSPTAASALPAITGDRARTSRVVGLLTEERKSLHFRSMNPRGGGPPGPSAGVLVVPDHISENRLGIYRLTAEGDPPRRDEDVIRLASEAADGIIRFSAGTVREASGRAAADDIRPRDPPQQTEHQARELKTIADDCLAKAVRLYSKEDLAGYEVGWIYQEMNSYLRKARQIDVAKDIDLTVIQGTVRRYAGDLAPFAMMVWEALKRLPPPPEADATLYRGMRVNPVVIEDYRGMIGKCALYIAFQSFSDDRGEALKFAKRGSKGVSVLFVLASKKRRMIMSMTDAKFQNEREVLLPPGAAVCVEGVDDATADDPIVVRLRDIEGRADPGIGEVQMSHQ